MTYAKPQFRGALTTDNAGVLDVGDEFEIKLNDTEGGNFSHFVFHGLMEGSKGSWVSAFGGDPVRAQHAHRRQWHSLSVIRVVSDARPCRPTWRSKRRV